MIRNSLWTLAGALRLSVLTLLIVAAGQAEPGSTQERVALTPDTAAGKGGTTVGGYLDVRPSWESQLGAWRLENEVGIEVSLNPSLLVGYTQEFQANLYHPDVTGIDPQAIDGYFKGELNNLWTRGRVSLSYEGRVYLPTWAVTRDAGMVTMIRNYAKLAYKVSDHMEVSLWEVPILHLYGQAGVARADEEDPGEANPFLENRVYLNTSLTFLDQKLAIEVPIILQNFRHSFYRDGARYNDGWSHILWINPEVTYAITPSTAVGAAYYSENLISDDFATSDFGGGFRAGVTQLIFKQSI